MLCSPSDAGKEGRKYDIMKISKKNESSCPMYSLPNSIKKQIGVRKTLAALEGWLCRCSAYFAPFSGVVVAFFPVAFH